LVAINRTTVTLQVVENPFLRRGARNGQRKIILVNKTSDDVEVNIAGETAQKEAHVDTTSAGLQTNSNLISNRIILHAFAVMCVTLPPEAG
jgi:hypothetical protein